MVRKKQHKRDPLPLPRIRDFRVLQRFTAKVNAVTGLPCWLWKGKPNKGGYGQFSLGKKKLLAHRVSYAIHNGEIPENMTVEHKCRNKSCVNPEHLILLPHDRNVAHRNRYNGNKAPQPIGQHIGCGGDVYEDDYCYGCGEKVGDEGIVLMGVEVADDSIPF